MPDYKEMYLKLFRATESAISCLIAAQQECEELYVNSSEAEIKAVTHFAPSAEVTSAECANQLKSDTVLSVQSHRIP